MAQVTLRKVVKMYDEVQAVRGIDLEVSASDRYPFLLSLLYLW